jgi:cell envelope opacity-associated protein A
MATAKTPTQSGPLEIQDGNLYGKASTKSRRGAGATTAARKRKAGQILRCTQENDGAAKSRRLEKENESVMITRFGDGSDNC